MEYQNRRLGHTLLGLIFRFLSAAQQQPNAQGVTTALVNCAGCRNTAVSRRAESVLRDRPGEPLCDDQSFSHAGQSACGAGSKRRGIDPADGGVVRERREAGANCTRRTGETGQGTRGDQVPDAAEDGGHIGVVAGDQATVYSVVQSADGPARDDVGRAVQEHGGGGQSGGGVVLYRKICAQIAD